MTEEEKMVFWGDLVEPITALVGGLLVRGEYKLVDVVKDIVAKAENAALEEREWCAEFLLSTDLNGLKFNHELQNFIATLLLNYATAIRARGQ